MRLEDLKVFLQEMRDAVGDALGNALGDALGDAPGDSLLSLPGRESDVCGAECEFQRTDTQRSCYRKGTEGSTGDGIKPAAESAAAEHRQRRREKRIPPCR